MSENSVKVAIRVRPLSEKEIEKGATECVVVDGQSVMVCPESISPSSSTSSRKRTKKQFSFDFCYGNESTQNDVFRDIGESVLTNALSGYNTSVFAYGQTGSGKTHTMLGEPGTEGLIPRICAALVSKLNTKERNEDDLSLTCATSTRYKLEASYLEIYNEKCLDLLYTDKKDTQSNLKIREHPKHGPYVEGLVSKNISTMEEIEEMMAVGSKARTVACTNMNSKSSRSHAIFTLVFTQTSISSDMSSATDTVSKINLVDLAGSERVNASGVQGKHLKEAANINRSLHSLGRVINALSKSCEQKTINFNFEDEENSPPPSSNSETMVPYRDSTLTWLLKPSLGGNSKTTMLAAVSPASFNFDESLTTLRYAQECSRVVNKAVINRDPNKLVIEELRSEIDLLRERLAVQTEASNAMINLNEELQEHKRAVELQQIESRKAIEEVTETHTKHIEVLMATVDEKEQMAVKLSVEHCEILKVKEQEIDKVKLELDKTTTENAEALEAIEASKKKCQVLQIELDGKIASLTELENLNLKQSSEMKELKNSLEESALHISEQEAKSKAEICALQASIESLEIKVHKQTEDLEVQVKRQTELEMQLEEATKQLENVQEQVASNTSKLAEAQATLELRQSTIDALQNQATESTIKNSELQMLLEKEREDASNVSNSLNQEIQTCKATNTELVANLAKLTENLQNESTSLTCTSTELQKVSQEYSDTQANIQKLSNQIAELEGTLETKVQQLEDGTNAKQVSDEEIAKLQVTLEELRNELSTTRDSLAMNETQLQEMSALLKNSEERLRTAQDENSQVATVVKQMESDMQLKLGEITQITKERTELESQLRSETEQLLANLSKLEADLETEKTTLQNTEFKNLELGKEVEEKTQQLGNSEAESTRLQEYMKHMESEFQGRFSTMTTDHAKSISEMELQLKEKNEEADRLILECNAERGKYDTLIVASKELEETIVAANEAKSLVQSHLDHVSEQHSNAVQELARLTERNQVLENKNELLEKDMVTMTTAIEEERGILEGSLKNAADLNNQNQAINNMMLEERNQLEVLSEIAKVKEGSAQQLMDAANQQRECNDMQAAELECRESKLQKETERVDIQEASFSRDLKYGCFAELKLRKEVELLVATHKNDISRLELTLKEQHQTEIEKTEVEYLHMSNKLQDTIMELKESLLSEKELRRQETERHTLLFEKEEFYLEEQVTRAADELNRLKSKLSTTKGERQSSEEALAAVKTKLEETQSTLLASEEVQNFKLLLSATGVTVMKFPRNGKKPHARYIYLVQERGQSFLTICKRSRTNRQSLLNRTNHEAKLSLASMVQIVAGCDTDTFHAHENKINPSSCFSIVTPERSWDLQCISPKQCQEFVKGFSMLVREVADTCGSFKSCDSANYDSFRSAAIRETDFDSESCTSEMTCDTKTTSIPIDADVHPKQNTTPPNSGIASILFGRSPFSKP